jgi:hypothetical protein
MNLRLKTISIILLSIFSILVASAQDNATTNYNQGFRLGFGINGAAVLDKPYDFALGADARLQYDLSKKYSLTLTTGFSNLFVKGNDNDLGYIPAKLGFKAFVIEDQFYLMGELGGAFAVTNGYNKSSYLISPSIGYATKYIDISLRYELLPDFSSQDSNGINRNGINQIGLRLAYGFAL